MVQWALDGAYWRSCKDCSLTDSGSTLQCSRKGSVSPYSTTTLNLGMALKHVSSHPTGSFAEERIANYDGHLLSNLTGAVTSVPADSSYPIPSDFKVELEVSTLNNSCTMYAGTITLNNPTSCFYLNLRVEYSWACGNSVNNQGWEIVGYSDEDCTSDPVATFMRDNQGTCLTFSTGVKGFSVTPLWNAD
ncbi:hypothetical protein CNMCM5793_004180 [Aspergillus hiratsukae]|uniref:Cyanovirin-N domain-containing protein n=1 Tax=Aspergillus hiratsukae TaxID=1194566 RepID=A0A8H6PS64_9EURO|nr:hypothetical protein CNMCM5793_004180 [Aspergillus hiratsukae]KAF7159139.1 hypothetical protein CNMCM6106_006224 [Aspergillus hiratsukae]